MVDSLKEALGPKIRGFSSVRVAKDRLLYMLKKNLEKHVMEFKEARLGYEKAFVVELERNLKLAKEKKEFNRYIQLEEPVNHEGDYSSVITLLEFSSDTEFELTQQEFNSFVRDEWHWKGAFTTTSNAYKNR